MSGKQSQTQVSREGQLLDALRRIALMQPQPDQGGETMALVDLVARIRLAAKQALAKAEGHE